MKRWVLAACLGAALGIRGGAQVHETHKLTASEGVDRFGWSSAVSESYALVGMWTDDDLGSYSGSVFVFDRTSGQQLRKLTASDGADGHNFGYSVAISGDIAVVGALKADGATGESGSAYVFDVSTGQQLRTLTASDGRPLDYFGSSVAMSGGLAVIGAKWHTVPGGLSTGAAYLFDLETGLQLHKFTPSDGDTNDDFGCSVSMAGSLAVIGAELDSDSGQWSGSAYVFDVQTGQQLRKLTASDAESDDRFGSAVALSGNIAVIGAYGDGDLGADSGAAYLFEVTTGQELFKLTASDGAAADRFAWAVARSGTLAVIGSFAYDGQAVDCGKVYVFDVTTGQEVFGLTAFDGTTYGALGYSVAICENTILAGALYDYRVPSGRGSAYLFSLPGRRYGHGCAGTGGIVPVYDITGDATPGGLINLEISDAVGGSVAFIGQGLERASLPMGPDCTLNLALPAVQFLGPFYLYPYHGSGAGNGWLEIQIAVPPSAPPGLSFTSQVFIVDSGVPRGFSNSNGVEVPYQ